ncbi:MAG: hypothetical protein HOU01_11965 [Streptomycetaceae bacterium]|nr:hypothetical protein [Streptomycetaceae bacterium]
MANFIQDKPALMFRLFDTDKDGAITVADFHQRADQIIRQFPGADAEKTNLVRDQYDRLWNELSDAADTDGDGRITEKEFAAVMVSATPQQASAMLGDRLGEFVLADQNGDGYLDRQEITQLLKGYGVEPRQVDTVMQILDRDGDGRISMPEYRSMLAEAYVAEDPSAPGVAIFEQIHSA